MHPYGNFGNLNKITLKTMDIITYLEQRIARLQALLAAFLKVPTPPNEVDLRAAITAIANEVGVDPEKVLKIIQCESGFNVKAINENSWGSIDRGICQFNDFWHPEISDEQAFDYKYAVRAMCERIKKGGISDWNASKMCWDI